MEESGGRGLLYEEARFTLINTRESRAVQAKNVDWFFDG